MPFVSPRDLTEEGRFLVMGMPVEPEQRRGHMRREWTIWCGRCVRWDSLEGTAYSGSNTEKAEYLGWKNTKAFGWVCPDCLKEGSDL